MTRKFCVMTVGRSGSTSLMECLEPHEDIVVPKKNIPCEDNELIHPKRQAEQIASFAALCGKPIRTREELIEAFYEWNAARPYTGFKTMPNRHPDYERFTRREDIRFITLKRRDVASTAASFLRATATGSWRRHGEPRPDTWRFDARRDARALKANLSYIHRSHAQLAAIPGAIHLDYEDLCDPRHVPAALDAFFGRPIRLLDPRPPTSGADYVENWPEFSAFVEAAWRDLGAGPAKAVCVVLGAMHGGRGLVSSLLEAHPGISVAQVKQTPDGLTRERLEELGPPLRVIHVVRHPRHNIALLGAGEAKTLPRAIEAYFGLARTIDGLRRQLAPSEYLELRYEDLLADPRRRLREVCAFLGQAVSEGYLEACTRKLAERVEEPLPGVRWTDEQKKRVRAEVEKFSFLASYATGPVPVPAARSGQKPARDDQKTPTDAWKTPRAAPRRSPTAAGRVFYAWELGMDLGHLLRFLGPALKLRERGHEVVFAVRDLSNAETTLGHHGFPLMQAPIWIANSNMPPVPPVSYAEIILRYGFINYPGLKALVKAWRELFRHTQPGLVLADHSPTALLAARTMGVRHAPIGSGFFSPPLVKPLPPMRSWSRLPQKRLEQSDAAATQIANRVIADLGGPPLGSLADLFRADENFLCTFEELDHYDHRGPARYWGPTMETEQGVELAWPAGEGARVFAYIKGRHRDFGALLEALAGSGQRVLAYAPGITREQLEKYSSPRMVLSREPLKLKKILKDCDLVLCHAGPGTVTAALLSGVPLLLIPTQLEQYLTCRRIKQLGAGLHVELERKKGDKHATPDYPALMRQLLGDPVFRERARAFAKKYSAFSQQGQAVALATRIEEILHT